MSSKYSVYRHSPEQVDGGEIPLIPRKFPRKGKIHTQRCGGNEEILYYDHYLVEGEPPVRKVIGYKRSDPYLMQSGMAILYHPVPKDERTGINNALGGECQFHEHEG